MQSEVGAKITTGTPGLDEVLDGGVLQDETTVITGGPGTGKTVLALQFLAAGDSGLYIGFEEREAKLRRNARALGIDLSSVRILDLSAPSDQFFSDDSYTVFSSEEVEGTELLEQIGDALDETTIDRLVIDPLSELRSLLPDDFQFRRNISSLFNALADRGVTTLCTAQPGADGAARDIQFLGNTIIELHRSTERRTLEVTKNRGSAFASGQHTYRIRADTGGRVYPKLVPGNHHRDHDRDQLASGLPTLDTLLGGGLERGSVTVISGPSGVGKTTTASYFLQATGDRGDRGAAFLFEELRNDYLHRCSQLGLSVAAHADAGLIAIDEVESLTRTPDEFTADVRAAVEDDGVEVVMIDGVTGYRQSLRGDDSASELIRELHALCRYLKRMGVTVILIEEVPYVTGEFAPTTNKISYLADNIMFLRYLEAGGAIEKAIGVLKKRYGEFDNDLRAFTITSDGVQVGEPLTEYQGLLSGVAETRTDNQT